LDLHRQGLGAQASNGKILLSKTTADRVKAHFSLNSLGGFSLKNVTGEIEIFEV
jgi:class 3 adenylate cyclase